MAPDLNVPSLTVFRNRKELCQKAADLFIRLSRKVISVKGRFTVVLSGGSTPQGLYRYLASPDIQKQLLWEKVHFFWGDERFVSKTHSDSNYGWARDHFFSKIPVPETHIHPIQTEGFTPQESANHYENTLKSFFKEGGFPRFDLVLLGIGEDGHTASLFPGVPALEERERWVEALFVEKIGAYRITLTPPAINSADRILFLVTGREKAAILREIFDPEKNGDYPVHRIRPVQGVLTFYVDQEAAGQLPEKNDR
ncbi:MAG: 6-phosphogluconolactonase [Nitrospiria bacterium]